MGLKLLLERTIYIRIVLLWSGHQSLTVYTIGKHVHVRMKNTTRYIYFQSSIWFDFRVCFCHFKWSTKAKQIYSVRTCILGVRRGVGGGCEKSEIYKVASEMFIFYHRKYAKNIFSEVNIIMIVKRACIILFTEWNHIQVEIFIINIINEHTPSIIT